ncbi:helix-turn-helix domain-containing protein [Streptomyces sp. NPDC048385]|uniref:AfsR/SARP family transcriptional regulator n=1 Tax=unclassified Streptomyces TaxID=2593676 RepID=UPI00343B97BA
MDIGVLGALDVRENGVPSIPTAPKPRRVLAVLALHADQAVSVATLTEELWGRRPPRSALPTLQTYIMHLRALIAPAAREAGDGAGARTAKQVLRTVPGGYLLDSGQGTSDVREFERLADTGYRTREAGDQRAAARLLRAALGLWRGPTLSREVRPRERLRITICRPAQDARPSKPAQRLTAPLGRAGRPDPAGSRWPPAPGRRRRTRARLRERRRPAAPPARGPRHP